MRTDDGMTVSRAFDWEKLSSVLESGRKIALFLDYDGTLVRIRKDPGVCVLSARIKELLLKLSKSDRCYVVIISGRALSNLKKLAGVPGICYAGNHGFEMSGPGLRFTLDAALKARPALIEAKRLLTKKIRGIKGAFLEDKKFSITLHYRSVNKMALPSLFKYFNEVCAPFLGKKLGLIKGKMVLELVPNARWNKGFAALWLLENMGGDFFPIYAGDDTTDETAFKALKKIGITIKVGKSNKTSAIYRIEKQVDLIKILETIENSRLK